VPAWMSNAMTCCSAGWRIVCAAMVSLREHQRKAARARWAKVTAKQRAEAAAHASRAYWDAMSPEQRSAEMKRRAKKRKKRTPRR
jgi:hypothetical protein